MYKKVLKLVIFYFGIFLTNRFVWICFTWKFIFLISICLFGVVLSEIHKVQSMVHTSFYQNFWKITLLWFWILELFLFSIFVGLAFIDNNDMNGLDYLSFNENILNTDTYSIKILVIWMTILLTSLLLRDYLPNAMFFWQSCQSLLLSYLFYFLFRGDFIEIFTYCQIFQADLKVSAYELYEFIKFFKKTSEDSYTILITLLKFTHLLILFLLCIYINVTKLTKTTVGFRTFIILYLIIFNYVFLILHYKFFITRYVYMLS